MKTPWKGNKTSGKSLLVTAGAGLAIAAFLFGGIISEKRAKIRLYEKKYAKAVSGIEIKNQQALSEAR